MQVVDFNEFKLIVLSDYQWDVNDDNIDVQVILKSGKQYAATFFTLRNISTLFHKFEADNDFAKGSYFWTTHGIILRDLSNQTIQSAILDLIDTDNIGKAMLEIIAT